MNFIRFHTHIVFTFFMYTDTEQSAVEQAFTSYTNRLDIGIILINQHVNCPTLLTTRYIAINILLYAIYVDC